MGSALRLAMMAARSGSSSGDARRPEKCGTIAPAWWVITRRPGYRSKQPEYTSRTMQADVSYGQPSDHQIPYSERLSDG